MLNPVLGTDGYLRRTIFTFLKIDLSYFSPETIK